LKSIMRSFLSHGSHTTKKYRSYLLLPYWSIAHMVWNICYGIILHFLMERMSKLKFNIIQVIVQIYKISNLSSQLYLLYKYNNKTPTWHNTIKVNSGYFTFDHNCNSCDLILILYQGDIIVSIFLSHFISYSG
jgi:hypothetical protein